MHALGVVAPGLIHLLDVGAGAAAEEGLLLQRGLGGRGRRRGELPGASNMTEQLRARAFVSQPRGKLLCNQKYQVLKTIQDLFKCCIMHWLPVCTRGVNGRSLCAALPVLYMSKAFLVSGCLKLVQ